jgi:dolichol-phosphate mannosyltransferase
MKNQFTGNTIHLLLPAYNEEANIAERIGGIAETMRETGIDHFRILVVDDGSTDRTAAILAEEKARQPEMVDFISHDCNRGPGAAFGTGFEALLARVGDQDIVITMDADNTHNVKTLRMLINKLGDGYEVVVASGWADGGMMIGIPFLRWVFTFGCNRLYRLLFPIRGVTCYTGFFRGFRAGALREVRNRYGNVVSCTGFAAMAELLVRCRSIPLFCAEVPFLMRFDQRKGVSNIRILRTIREHLGVFANNMFTRKVV